MKKILSYLPFCLFLVVFGWALWFLNDNDSNAHVVIYSPGTVIESKQEGTYDTKYELVCRGKSYHIVLASDKSDLNTKLTEAVVHKKPVVVFGCAGTRNFEKYVYVTKINIGK